MSRTTNVIAESFATTPAGYITGIVLPVIIGAVAWLVIRLITKVDRVEAAMVAQTQALAVLVTQVAPIQEKQSESAKKINELEKATAVLQSTLDKHEAWSAREHERIRDRLGET